MFERYTETARRMIFFARYEASQHGSSYIEPEHLLLGMTREEKRMLKKFLPPTLPIESFRQDIEAVIPVRSPGSTSVDLPLSRASRRVLEYAAEESANAGHTVIANGHLLIGLLRESGSAAARLLADRGLTRELILSEIEAPQSAAPPPPMPREPVSRETAHKLVDEIPDDRLSLMAYMVQTVKNLPSGSIPNMQGLSHLLRRLGHPGKPNCTSHLENGVLTVETHQTFEGHKVDALERWSVSEDGKVLKCTREITIDGRSSQSETEFDVS
jgi:hypothetical protein